jgi:hypothetical protein
MKIILKRAKLGGHMDTTRLQSPHQDFWSLLSGSEGAFTDVRTLYHALSDPGAKITDLSLSSSYDLRIIVQQGDVYCSFDLDARQGDASPYHKGIVQSARKRSKMFAVILEGLWSTSLAEESRLQRLLKV